MTVFSPPVYELFDELFDLKVRTDFEGVLFPVLARQRQLYSAIIPTETWFQVNDPKSLQKLMEVVASEPAPSLATADQVARGNVL